MYKDYKAMYRLLYCTCSFTFTCIVKPVFKGYSDESRPFHQGHFLRKKFNQLYVKEPVMKGHLPCSDTFFWIVMCVSKMWLYRT